MNTKPLRGLALFLSGGLFASSFVALSADERESTNYPSGSMDISYTNSHGIVTKQTIGVEATNVKDTITLYTSNYVKFLSSFTNVEQTNVTWADKALAANMLTNAAYHFITNSAFIEESAEIGDSSGKFFDDLKAQGHLPGISKDGHGLMTAEGSPSTDDSGSPLIKYPFLITYDVVLTDDVMTNHYTIIRPSKGSPWQLQKAWRTDLEGHVIKEWPVKSP